MKSQANSNLKLHRAEPSRNRAAARFLAFAALLALAGCADAEKEAEKKKMEKEKGFEQEVAPSRRPLEMGETALFEFETDGYWHPAPYAVYNGQRIRVVPAGDAVYLGKNVIEFRVEKLKQVVSDRTEFTVTNPGRIYFKLDPAKVPGFAGHAQVQITRVQ